MQSEKETLRSSSPLNPNAEAFALQSPIAVEPSLCTTGELGLSSTFLKDEFNPTASADLMECASTEPEVTVPELEKYSCDPKGDVIVYDRKCTYYNCSYGLYDSEIDCEEVYFCMKCQDRGSQNCSYAKTVWICWHP